MVVVPARAARSGTGPLGRPTEVNLMMRRAVGLVVLLCAAGLVSGQEKKSKSTKKVEKGHIKATVVKVDTKKRTLTVKMDGKTRTLTIGKSVKFVGPRGGARTAGLKDKGVKPGTEIHLIMDGKNVKEVHLQTMKTTKTKKTTTKTKKETKEKPRE
jgi:hypothetical protein